MGNSELAARPGRTRPTVARLASTLARLGYLRYHASVSKYALWTGAIRASHPWLVRNPIRQWARPGMRALAADLKAVVSLVLLDADEALVLEASQGLEIEGLAPEIGLTMSVLQTAAGRAVVSLLPDAEREALLLRVAEHSPDLWQRFGAATRASVQICRRQGYCAEPDDHRGHVQSVGVPLMRTADGICFALGCSIEAFRLRPGQLQEEIGPRLLGLARSIRATAAGTSDLLER